MNAPTSIRFKKNEVNNFVETSANCTKVSAGGGRIGVETSAILVSRVANKRANEQSDDMSWGIPIQAWACQVEHTGQTSLTTLKRHAFWETVNRATSNISFSIRRLLARNLLSPAMELREER